jgi:hypothetical protein
LKANELARALISNPKSEIRGTGKRRWQNGGGRNVAANTRRDPKRGKTAAKGGRARIS